jgi:hypothetical protein
LTLIQGRFSVLAKAIKTERMRSSIISALALAFAKVRGFMQYKQLHGDESVGLTAA